MTSNQHVHEAKTNRVLKVADQLLTKYKAIGPAAIKAALSRSCRSKTAKPAAGK